MAIEDQIGRPHDAHPAGCRMPAGRKKAILKILEPRTDILEIIQPDNNCIHVRDIKTNDRTSITDVGTAQLYVDRLDGKIQGGPI